MPEPVVCPIHSFTLVCASSPACTVRCTVRGHTHRTQTCDPPTTRVLARALPRNRLRILVSFRVSTVLLFICIKHRRPTLLLYLLEQTYPSSSLSLGASLCTYRHRVPHLLLLSLSSTFPPSASPTLLTPIHVPASLPRLVAPTTLFQLYPQTTPSSSDAPSTSHSLLTPL